MAFHKASIKVVAQATPIYPRPASTQNKQPLAEDVERGGGAAADEQSTGGSVGDAALSTVPTALLIVYMVLGGIVFAAIEGQHDINAKRTLRHRYERGLHDTARMIFEVTEARCFDYNASYLSNDTLFTNNGTNGTDVSLSDLFEIYDSHVNQTADDEETMYILAKEFVTPRRQLAEHLVRRFSTAHGTEPRVRTLWDFWGSLFFSGTVLTTIGYGNMTPVTTSGRIFTVLYAIIGIPLMLYCITQYGDVMVQIMWYIWARGRIFICTTIARREIIIGEREDFPFFLALATTIIWVALGSLLFNVWEQQWTYFESAYFLFQSLTTIGFGDVTPTRPRYMVLSFFLIIIGMTLVSMCWNFAQLKMEKLAQEIMEKIQDAFLQKELQQAEAKAAGDENDEAAEARVNKLASEQGGLLGSLLLKGRRREQLVEEWQRQARLCHTAVQTLNPVTNIAIDATVSNTESCTQTMPPDDPSDGTEPPPSPPVPLREQRANARPMWKQAAGAGRRSASVECHDFRNKLSELRHVLRECNELVHAKQPIPIFPPM